MGIILDIIIVAIIAIFTFIGYKQGLIKVAIKITAFFIAIIVSLVLYKPISNEIIKNTKIDDNIKNTIVEKITPEGLTKDAIVTSQIKIPEKIVNTTNNSIENIATELTIKIIRAGVLIILFIVIRIILVFISALANFIAKLPILKQFNKAGGFIYGLLKGIIIIYAVLGAILICKPFINEKIESTIDSSIITKQIYNNNLLLNTIL